MFGDNLTFLLSIENVIYLAKRYSPTWLYICQRYIPLCPAWPSHSSWSTMNNVCGQKCLSHRLLGIYQVYSANILGSIVVISKHYEISTVIYLAKDYFSIWKYIYQRYITLWSFSPSQIYGSSMNNVYGQKCLSFMLIWNYQVMVLTFWAKFKTVLFTDICK